MRIRTLALATAVSALAFPTAAQDAAPLGAEIESTTKVLIQQGLRDTAGLKFVEDLTTEVGARLAGSPQEALARDWAVAELNELGFADVRVEKFEIPYWSRVTDEVSITSPSVQAVAATALGGSAETPEGGVEAELVRFTSLAALIAAPASQVSGKIVFIDEHMIKSMNGAGYGMAVRKRGG